MASTLEACREDNPGSRFFVVAGAAGAAGAGELPFCWSALDNIFSVSEVNFFLQTW